MNLLLLHEADRVEGGRFVVRGERARHVVEVIRAEEGRGLRVGLLEGPLGRAAVVSARRDEVVLECAFEDEPPARPLVDLVLAVPRPKSLKKLLPEVAALGVDRLILLRTWRVATPYLEVDVLRPEVYRPLLHEGMMQGRTTREPTLTVEPLFKPFVEDRAPALAKDALALVAHPTAELHLARAAIAPDARVVLALGPEGGFIPYEVDALRAAGFTPVTLGPRTLRVETACVAVLANVALLREVYSATRAASRNDTN